MRATIALLALLAAPLARGASQTVTIKVAGWHSKGDGYKTEAAVRAVKGVTSASADTKALTLVVSYEDTQATRQQVEQAIASAGYSVAK